MRIDNNTIAYAYEGDGRYFCLEDTPVPKPETLYCGVCGEEIGEDEDCTEMNGKLLCEWCSGEPER